MVRPRVAEGKWECNDKRQRRAGELVPLRDDLHLSLPALVGREGARARWRFLEFFTVHIRNANTRSAYTHAAGLFLAWCETRGISELRSIQPVHVAGYIEQMQRERSAPTVKQHLTCLRMLFGWLVTVQVIPSNPAHAVRGPRGKDSCWIVTLAA